MDSYDLDSKNSEVSNDTNIYLIIALISTIVFSFLIWLIYFRNAGVSVEQGHWVNHLPELNAFLNTLTSIFLVTGYVFIKRNRVELHKLAMGLAAVSLIFFLISYITYHSQHGDTKFVGTGIIRPVYMGILISHILLSAIQVPLILSTFYLAATKKFVKHKKIAKITFPIWLYVSVTGVLIFVMLKWFNS